MLIKNLDVQATFECSMAAAGSSIDLVDHILKKKVTTLNFFGAVYCLLSDNAVPKRKTSNIRQKQKYNLQPVLSFSQHLPSTC